ncbi:MAG: sce7725 family protein [Chitinophagaceae bacterium]
MYYPYLRARQFELISLRELASANVLQNYVTPVLEPVKETFNNLNLAHKVFEEKELNCFLIVNPLVGEIPGDTNIFLDYISSIDNCHFLPAFHYTNNREFIINSILKYKISKCLLIGYENFNDDTDLRFLCNHENVSHIMIYQPHQNRSLDRFIKALNKKYIRLDDVFEKQVKNADFLDISAHKFSEEHLYYIKDGYQGFSDFTVLPSEYVDGGSTPRAVVIHLTYIKQDEENQIWIRHFTSDTNDSIANVQGKFAEAAQKAVGFCGAEGLNNSAIGELRAYFNEAKYPGLGTVKKICIKHHLHIVTEYLVQRDAIRL